MRRGRSLLLLLGLAVLAGVVYSYGFEAVISSFSKAGVGLLGFLTIHTLVMALHAAGWAVLFDRNGHPTAGWILWARWISESVNSLLPVAQVGGDAVRARLTVQAGIDLVVAIATVVVDVTRGLVVQLALTLLAFLLLLERLGAGDTFVRLVVGVLVLATMVGVFLLAQRLGLFGLATRLASTLLKGFDLSRHVERAELIDLEIASRYTGWRRRLETYALRLLGRLAGIAEFWVGLLLLGTGAGPVEAFILHSVSGAARSAAFLIPGGLGVQEGTLALLATVVGIPPESAVALGLMIRTRELVYGVPGILTWFALERRVANE